MCADKWFLHFHTVGKGGELAEEQDKQNLPKDKLKADGKTRWESVLDTINNIVEQQEPIRIILANDR